MRTIVEADGDDLVVILPQELIDDLELKPGDDIDITEENEKVVLTPAKTQR